MPIHRLSTHDVIIAGAGPVGLFLACELALAGVSVLVLEAAADLRSPLKGLPFGMRGLSAPTLEALYRRDLLMAVEAAQRSNQSSGAAEAASHWMQQQRRPAGHFAGIQFFHEDVDTARWPYRLPNPAGVNLAVDMQSLEAVLAERAVSLDIEIRRGSGIEGFEQSDERVTVQTDGRSFHARWLVGCDGGRSTVRKAGGFAFVGTDPEFTGYSLEAELADPEALSPGRTYTATGMYTYARPGVIAIADFDGDGLPEIGVAMATFYSMLKPNFATHTIDVKWQTPNHDLSSSVTGSSVFDFEGDGKAEVIYGDECFLWVFDGQTGAVRFAAPHSSFTGTEASLVADVDGDGRAEMLMVSNGADPSANGWKCMDASGTPVTVNGVKWTPGPAVGKGYRGITVFGDAASSWVGTRTLWSAHTYHVSNICDDRDSACDAPNVYGSIPKKEKKNWTLPWLNNFRQNVQDKGLFDAPDATVSLSADCSNPVVLHASVRNIGLASLPAGVVVNVFTQNGGTETKVGTATTTHALFPGQTEELVVKAAPSATTKDTFIARIYNDPSMPTFHECRENNDASLPTSAHCVQ